MSSSEGKPIVASCDDHCKVRRVFLPDRKEIRGFIKTSRDLKDIEKNFDSLGYDLSVGEVHVVTQGKLEKFKKPDCGLIVYPGDTLVVRSEEQVTLPSTVFAMGAPKMKLLVAGLWGHGGKTDPGYSGNLTLCFHHVGSEPVTITKFQSIFHLSFFQISGHSCSDYPGVGPGWPENPIQSPLDSETLFEEKDLDRIKSYEGIDIFRVCRHFVQHRNQLERKFETINAQWRATKWLFSFFTIVPLLMFLGYYYFPQFSFWTGLVGSATIYSVVALINHLLGIFDRCSKWLEAKK